MDKPPKAAGSASSSENPPPAQEEPWLASVARSLMCATPRKPLEAYFFGQRTIAQPQAAGDTPSGRGEDMEQMRRHAAELDGQIADLRRSLGGSPKAGVELADAAEGSSATPAAGSASLPMTTPPPRPQSPPRSPPTAPLSARAMAAIDELTRGLRRAVTPSFEYGPIGSGGAARRGSGSVDVVPPPAGSMPTRGKAFHAKAEGERGGRAPGSIRSPRRSPGRNNPRKSPTNAARSAQIEAEQAAAEAHAEELRRAAYSPAAAAAPSPLAAARAAAANTSAALHASALLHAAAAASPREADEPPASPPSRPQAYGEVSPAVSPASVYPSPYQPTHRWGAPLLSPSNAQRASRLAPSPQQQQQCPRPSAAPQPSPLAQPPRPAHGGSPTAPLTSAESAAAALSPSSSLYRLPQRLTPAPPPLPSPSPKYIASPTRSSPSRAAAGDVLGHHLLRPHETVSLGPPPPPVRVCDTSDADSGPSSGRPSPDVVFRAARASAAAARAAIVEDIEEEIEIDAADDGEEPDDAFFEEGNGDGCGGGGGGASTAGAPLSSSTPVWLQLAGAELQMSAGPHRTFSAAEAARVATEGAASSYEPYVPAGGSEPTPEATAQDAAQAAEGAAAEEEGSRLGVPHGYRSPKASSSGRPSARGSERPSARGSGRRSERRVAADVDEWPAEAVAEWLGRLGLEQYADGFVANHVDGAALRLLSRDDLNALGVQSVGHRLLILRTVAELCQDGEARGTPQLSPRLGTAARSLRFGGEGDSDF